MSQGNFESAVRREMRRLVTDIPLAVCPICGGPLDESVPFSWCDCCGKRADGAGHSSTARSKEPSKNCT